MNIITINLVEAGFSHHCFVLMAWYLSYLLVTYKATVPIGGALGTIKIKYCWLNEYELSFINLFFYTLLSVNGYDNK